MRILLAAFVMVGCAHYYKLDVKSVTTLDLMASKGERVCARGSLIDVLATTTDGKKHVESIPAEWIDAVRPAVEDGRGFKDSVAELFVINAQLLVLARQQRRRHPPVDPSPE